MFVSRMIAVLSATVVSGAIAISRTTSTSRRKKDSAALEARRQLKALHLQRWIFLASVTEPPSGLERLLLDERQEEHDVKHKELPAHVK